MTNHESSRGGSQPTDYSKKFDFVAGIDGYLSEAERENILRPRQDEVFGDIKTFLASESPRGYVQLPTGTGKTVIFVELSKAIGEARDENGEKPKILVVTPKIDLVHQTVGRSGEKGYGKFAPGLKVSAFFKDSTEEDRRSVQDSDVVVTTYKSMGVMSRHRQVTEKLDEDLDTAVEEALQNLINKFGTAFAPTQRHPKKLKDQLIDAEAELFSASTRYHSTGDRLLDLFDVYILDEAHHVLGEHSGDLVESIPENKPVIGFTATPDANQKRKLSSRLPTEIHMLAFNEAVELGLLSPLVPIGVDTGVSIDEKDIFDHEGEYLDDRISHLANSVVRNATIVNIAEVLARAKIGTIVSCLAGDEALHSRILAEQMRERGIKAEAVYGAVDSLERQRIYKQFERGEIDVLTFVEVLGEGWDSQRAKAIVNGRPTRSLIIAQQRAGRIVRPGDFAISIDLIDGYDKFNPPIHVADLLERVDVPVGAVFGEITAEQHGQKRSLLAQIGEVATLAPVLPADYSNFHARLEEYTKISSGNLATSSGKSYSISSRIVKDLKGVTDEIMDKLWLDSGRQPDVMEGVSQYTIRRTYERSVSEKLIANIPLNDPDKALREKDGSQWMSSQGLTVLFSNRFPDLNNRIMDRIVREANQLLDWKPLRHRKIDGRFVKESIYKAYKVDENSIELLNSQLADYFEIIDRLKKSAEM